MASIEDIAKEVIAGKWGSGTARKENLTNSGYDYAQVQNTVNSLMGNSGTSSVGSSTDTYGSSSGGNDYDSQINSVRDSLLKIQNDKDSGYSGYTNRYQDQINGLQSQIEARQNAFKYDAESDPLYQQYSADYTRKGQQAMEDTLGKVAARTGGLASSYAGTAAQQTYNNYMAELASKIPELQQLAKQMYDDETSNLEKNRDYYTNLENTEYSRYRDEKDREIDVLQNNLDMLLKLQANEQAKAAAKSSGSGGGNDSGGSNEHISNNINTDGDIWIEQLGWLTPKELQTAVNNGDVLEFTDGKGGYSYMYKKWNNTSGSSRYER